MRQMNLDADFAYLLGNFEGNCEYLWVVVGAVFGALDEIVMSLANLPPEGIVGTLADQSVSAVARGSSNDIISLLGNIGLEPASAIRICSLDLGGAHPQELRRLVNGDTRLIIGYWDS
ncbi:hypothetical protein F5X98DRAFT_387411 [Xylaria grammica]|nr:hypothetical protein F5X98DRAFT_387411 [Xylaria grammica]